MWAIIAHQNATYDTFIDDISGDGVETDNTGLIIPRTPDDKADLSAAYYLELGSGGSLTFGGDWTYTSEQELQTIPLAGVTQRGATHILNALVRRDVTENVSIGAFGRNLTDEDYFADAAQNVGWSAYQNFALPRTYGARGSINF